MFRQRHSHSLRDLFKQSIKLCEAAGMVSLRRVAVDGTKIAGAGSKDSSKTYARILRDEAALDRQVAALVQEGIDRDAAEDAEFGADGDGFRAPEHLRTSAQRKAAIREAKAKLDAAREAKSALKSRAKEKAATEYTDYGRLSPMAEQPAQNMGRQPELILADAGYFDRRDIQALAANGGGYRPWS